MFRWIALVPTLNNSASTSSEPIHATKLATTVPIVQVRSNRQLKFWNSLLLLTRTQEYNKKLRTNVNLAKELLLFSLLLFSANSAIFQLYHGENKLVFNEISTLFDIIKI
jgi:hypothetical protein